MNRRKLIKYDDILSGKGLKEAILKPKTHPPMPKCIPPVQINMKQSQLR